VSGVVILAAEIVGGVLMLSFGVLLLHREWPEWRRVDPRGLARAVGRVVEDQLEQGDLTLHRPVIEFTPAGGSPVRFESRRARSNPPWTVGSSIEIVYRPGRSYADDVEAHRSEVLGSLSQFAISGGLAVLGMAVLAAAILDWLAGSGG
jgi:hypothetical protein